MAATKQTQDFSKMMQDMMSAFPMDMSAMQENMKSYAELGEKMSAVVLEAAEKSTELQGKWAKETLAKLGETTKVQKDPQDYSKVISDFASAQAETTAETMAAFSEIAKKVQMDTVEVMMAAGKNLSEDAQDAVKKATAQAQTAARKATGAK